MLAMDVRVLVIGTVIATMSGSATVGWIRADGYARQETRPTLYWPANLLDGRDASVWCIDGGPDAARRQRIRIGFKGQVEVDRVRIATGDSRTAAGFAENNRVVRLVFDDGRFRRTVNLTDERGLQDVQLSPPIRGRHVDVILTEVAGEGDLTCMTTVLFYEGRRALNGPWMGRSLKYDRDKARLLGVWATGPQGAPERFLSVFLDGTFRYSYTPHDPTVEGFSVTGAYRFVGGRLQLQIRGQWRPLDARRVEGRDELGEPFVHLEISDADPEIASMEGTWWEWRP
jgi:hypothetical protein